MRSVEADLPYFGGVNRRCASMGGFSGTVRPSRSLPAQKKPTGTYAARAGPSHGLRGQAARVPPMDYGDKPQAPSGPIYAATWPHFAPPGTRLVQSIESVQALSPDRADLHCFMAVPPWRSPSTRNILDCHAGQSTCRHRDGVGATARYRRPLRPYPHSALSQTKLIADDGRAAFVRTGIPPNRAKGIARRFNRETKPADLAAALMASGLPVTLLDPELGKV